MPGSAKRAYLRRFPCSLLPVSAGRCALGGVSVASGGGRIQRLAMRLAYPDHGFYETLLRRPAAEGGGCS